MPARVFNLAILRLAEINRLCRDRYGGGDLYELPDDDSGRHDLNIMLHHHGMLHANPVRMRNVIAARAPWMESDEAAGIIQPAASSPRKWTAAALGEELGLTEADRHRLGIRTIGAIDITPEQRRQAKRLRDRQRQRRHRRAKGMKARTESITAAKPWAALGISRGTWYRRQRETESSRNMPDCHTQARNTPRHVRRTARLLATRYGYHFRMPDPTGVTFRSETGSSQSNRDYMA
jgi:hypothetical protein